MSENGFPKTPGLAAAVNRVIGGIDASEQPRALAGPGLTDEQYRGLAEDAIVVLAWAMRERMRREQQIEETVKAFKLRLESPGAATPASTEIAASSL